MKRYENCRKFVDKYTPVMIDLLFRYFSQLTETQQHNFRNCRKCMPTGTVKSSHRTKTLSI